VTEAGEAWAQCELGNRYGLMKLEDSFVKPNAEEAVRWLAQATETSRPRAGDSSASK